MTESQHQLTALFAAPEYISWRSDWYTDCFPHPDSGSSFAVASLEEPGVPLPIQGVLGSGGVDALQRAASEWLKNTPAEDQGCYLEDPVNGWAIVRGRTNWEIEGHVATANACRGADTEFPTSIPVPAHVVGFTEARGPNTSRPETVTTLRSPRGSITVEVARNGVVFVSTGRRPYERVTQPTPEGIDAVVLAQWAFDRHVAEWTTALSRLSRLGRSRRTRS